MNVADVWIGELTLYLGTDLLSGADFGTYDQMVVIVRTQRDLPKADVRGNLADAERSLPRARPYIDGAGRPVR